MHHRRLPSCLSISIALALLVPKVEGQFFGRQNKKDLSDADASTPRRSFFGGGGSSRSRDEVEDQWEEEDRSFVADFAEDVFDTVEDFVEDIQEAVVTVASPVFAGKVRPFLNKLKFTAEKGQAIVSAIKKATSLDDLAFLALFGWASIPAVQFFYEVGDDVQDVENAIVDDENSDIAADGDASKSDKALQPSDKRPFRQTKRFHIADHISQFCKIGLGVYAVDVLEILLAAVGFDFPYLDQMSEVFAKIAYTVWATERLRLFKRYAISKAAHRPMDNLGRAGIADHLVDSLVYGLAGFFLLDWLNLKLGLGIKSVLTLGSAGTLIISFATKDLAGQLINGLALTASDKIYEGEKVKFSDGISGTIEKMGWMETSIRMDDNHVLQIGNTELSNKRIINLSRTKASRVHQTLRFSYEDIDKLPKLLDDIQSEIRKACPKLIDDGSRPFRAVFVSYAGSHLEVEVEAHFNVPPTSVELYKSKENMLYAIKTAVTDNGMKFKA